MNRLSDEEWKTVRRLFPEPGARKPFGRPASDVRAVLDAILWVTCTGERWIHLPSDFPPQQTCYIKYLQWRRSGIIEQVHTLLATTRNEVAHSVPDDRSCDLARATGHLA